MSDFENGMSALRSCGYNPRDDGFGVNITINGSDWSVPNYWIFSIGNYVSNRGYNDAEKKAATLTFVALLTGGY